MPLQKGGGSHPRLRRHRYRRYMMLKQMLLIGAAAVSFPALAQETPPDGDDPTSQPAPEDPTPEPDPAHDSPTPPAPAQQQATTPDHLTPHSVPAPPAPPKTTPPTHH